MFGLVIRIFGLLRCVPPIINNNGWIYEEEKTVISFFIGIKAVFDIWESLARKDIPTVDVSASTVPPPTVSQQAPRNVKSTKVLTQVVII